MSLKLLVLVVACSFAPSSALGATPEPEIEVIPVRGINARYLVDRGRGLCYFQLDAALTAVDCAKVIAAKPESSRFGSGSRIQITARPWAQILVDGVPSGSTPKVMEVGPGRHTVTLVNGSRQVTLTVDAIPQGTHSVSHNFDE